MKKVMIFLLMISGALLFAQENMPFGNIRHSAVCADGFMRVSWSDATGGINPISCLYSINDGAWQEAAAGSYPNAEALVPYQYGQQLRYRLRTQIEYDTESIAFMNAAYLGSDTFPPTLNRMGLVGTDTTGDSVMVYVPALDIIDTYMAATSTTIYSTLSNATNTFPTFNSLSSYNAWMTLLMNPQGSPDITFAMLYTFNIPGLISPGLYKLGVDAEQNPTFSRLGNIQASVSGGKLYMACNIADLSTDPDFGTWPNEYNALGMVSASMRINIDISSMEPELLFGDYGTMGAVEFTDHAFSAPYNSLPEMLNPVYNNGELSVIYHDINGDYPLLAQFQSQSGNVYSMYQINLSGEDIIFQTFLNDSDNSGVFRFSDNLVNMVELPFDWTPVADETIPTAEISVRMPNPFRGPADIEIRGHQPGHLVVELYNLKGQKLGVLYSGSQSEFRWDGIVSGKPVSNGIYLLRVNSSGRIATWRFAIIK
jgi:hypothetical protein